jgi:DNA-binding MarR family transcriptional regulator
LTNEVAIAARADPPDSLPAGEVDVSEQDPAETSDIADALITIMRFYGSVQARLAATADSEVAPMFLLARLVKGGPKRAKDLADSMCADQSTVSRQVATLVKAGLIERKADPADGRASILAPTDLGLQRVGEHFRDRGQVIKPIIADWPAEERAEFRRLLSKYASNLEVRRDEVLGNIVRAHRSLDAEPKNPTPVPNRIERSN